MYSFLYKFDLSALLCDENGGLWREEMQGHAPMFGDQRSGNGQNGPESDRRDREREANFGGIMENQKRGRGQGRGGDTQSHRQADRSVKIFFNYKKLILIPNSKQQ